MAVSDGSIDTLTRGVSDLNLITLDGSGQRNTMTIRLLSACLDPVVCGGPVDLITRLRGTAAEEAKVSSALQTGNRQKADIVQQIATENSATDSR